MHQAFRASPEIVPRTLVATGAFPGSDKVYWVATKPADQMFRSEFAPSFADIELHIDEVIEIQREAASNNASHKLSWPGEMSRIYRGFVRIIRHANLRWYPRCLSEEQSGYP